MLLNNDLKLNLFGLETQYNLDKVVIICREKLIYAYSDEVKKLSVRVKIRKIKGLQRTFSLIYNLKPPPNQFLSYLNCLNSVIYVLFLFFA